MNNQNKIALITGASRGIGAATAIVMAEQGYDICINYLSDDQAAQHVQSKVLAYGRRCVAIKADASDPEQVNSMYQQIDTELGCLSVLVNNTGILKTQTELVNISIERFQQVLNTNVLSNFLCSQQAIKRMSTEYGGQRSKNWLTK